MEDQFMVLSSHQPMKLSIHVILLVSPQTMEELKVHTDSELSLPHQMKLLEDKKFEELQEMILPIHHQMKLRSPHWIKLSTHHTMLFAHRLGVNHHAAQNIMLSFHHPINE
jgi:hypothetical protein